MPALLLSLNTAPEEAAGADPGLVPLGMARRPVEGRCPIGALGLEGDQPIDAGASVGPGKAVYAYPSEHYVFWQTVRAQVGVSGWDDQLPHGALGEHLTLSGVLESDVWVGDLLRFSDCTLAVSEPRIPGPELNAALGFPQAAQAMLAQAWCGFYLAVRIPGTLAAGEPFEVVPGPREIGITELFRARVNRSRRDREERPSWF